MTRLTPALLLLVACAEGRDETPRGHDAAPELYVRPGTTINPGDTLRGALVGDDVFDVIGVTVAGRAATRPEGSMWSSFEVTLPADVSLGDAGSAIWLPVVVQWRSGETTRWGPEDDGACAIPATASATEEATDDTDPVDDTDDTPDPPVVEDPPDEPLPDVTCAAVEVIVGGTD